MSGSVNTVNPQFANLPHQCRYFCRRDIFGLMCGGLLLKKCHKSIKHGIQLWIDGQTLIPETILSNYERGQCKEKCAGKDNCSEKRN